MQDILNNEKPRALNEWAYDFIKELILELDLLPGEQIHIEEFTDKLGVSRTPIREAFLHLANDGLVDIRPRVGYFVSDITEQDIRELFEVREIIEAHAARRAAEFLTDEELELLVDLVNESKQAAEKGDTKTYLRNEITFHKYIQKYMNNKRLTTFMEGLDNLTYRERIMSIQFNNNITQTVIEHERILDSLLRREGDEAAWFMGEHLKNVSDRLIEYIRLNKNVKENNQNE